MWSARAHTFPLVVGAGLTALLGAGCDPAAWAEALRGASYRPPGGTDAGRPGDDGAAPGTPLPESCRCSRQLTAAVHRQCPRGSGDSTYAVIGPAGGALQLAGNQGAASGVSLELVIPAGALATETLITITELSSAPPAGHVDWSPLYRFEPEGLPLRVPARVRIPWSNTDGMVDRDLAIGWSADGGASFSRLSDDYVNAGFNQASIHRLGLGFVGSSPAAAAAACRAR